MSETIRIDCLSIRIDSDTVPIDYAAPSRNRSVLKLPRPHERTVQTANGFRSYRCGFHRTRALLTGSCLTSGPELGLSAPATTSIRNRNTTAKPANPTKAGRLSADGALSARLCAYPRRRPCGRLRSGRRAAWRAWRLTVTLRVSIRDFPAEDFGRQHQLCLPDPVPSRAIWTYNPTCRRVTG